MPDLIDGETGDFDSASFAQYRERTFEVPRPRRRGRLDNAERSILEFQGGDRGIFSLDPGQSCDRARMHAGDFAKEPLQHIDMMAGLIRQHPAVVSPGSAPVILIVIALIAAPAYAHRTEDQTAEPPGLQSLPSLDDRNVETILLDYKKLDPRLVAGAYHLVCVLK